MKLTAHERYYVKGATMAITGINNKFDGDGFYKAKSTTQDTKGNKEPINMKYPDLDEAKIQALCKKLGITSVSAGDDSPYAKGTEKITNSSLHKSITKTNIEDFLNEPHPSKAAANILKNSPVGLGKEPTKEDFEKMGYQFAGTEYHIGAPVTYKSGDGGTITVYNGKGSPNMGEDERKIIYQKGNLIQEMYYDENGNLQKGKIMVKDNIAGYTERKIDLFVDNGKISYID